VALTDTNRQFEFYASGGWMRLHANGELLVELQRTFDETCLDRVSICGAPPDQHECSPFVINVTGLRSPIFSTDFEGTDISPLWKTYGPTGTADVPNVSQDNGLRVTIRGLTSDRPTELCYGPTPWWRSSPTHVRDFWPHASCLLQRAGTLHVLANVSRAPTQDLPHDQWILRRTSTDNGASFCPPEPIVPWAMVYNPPDLVALPTGTAVPVEDWLGRIVVVYNQAENPYLWGIIPIEPASQSNPFRILHNNVPDMYPEALLDKPSGHLLACGWRVIRQGLTGNVVWNYSNLTSIALPHKGDGTWLGTWKYGWPQLSGSLVAQSVARGTHGFVQDATGQLIVIYSLQPSLTLRAAVSRDAGRTWAAAQWADRPEPDLLATGLLRWPSAFFIPATGDIHVLALKTTADTAGTPLLYPELYALRLQPRADGTYMPNDPVPVASGVAIGGASICASPTGSLIATFVHSPTQDVCLWLSEDNGNTWYQFQRLSFR